jgi:hypothetical protein
VATSCGCAEENVSLTTMRIVWCCAGCGQPRITVTGRLGHLVQVLLDQHAAFGLGARTRARIDSRIVNRVTRGTS